MALTKVKGHIIADDLALGGNPTTSTQSASDNSTKIATTAYVTTAVSNLVDGAPSTLNTLNEIAAALNDDAALNTTLTNSIATKLPLAGGTLTGSVNIGSYQGSSVNSPLDIKSDSNHFAISIEENSGTETWQLGVNADGDLNFYDSGATTPIVTFSDSNNIGIGEVDPDNKLDVNFNITGEGSQEGGIKIHNVRGSNNDIAPLYFGVHGGTRRTKAAIGLKREGSYGIGSLIFALDSNGDDANVTFANDEKMRIDSSGNVGIGVTPAAHSSTYKALQIGSVGSIFSHASATDAGSTFFGSNIYNNSGWKYITTNEASFIQQKNGEFYFARAASGSAGAAATLSYPFVINSSGNVGIGTDSPDYPIHVRGTGHQRIKVEKTDSGGDADISIAGPSDSTGWVLFTDSTAGANSGVIKYVHSTNKMHFRTNGTDNRLVIDESGDVGIGGVTAPSGLEVYSKDCKFWHGNTNYYTKFEDQNEINTYTAAGANSTMYLQHPGGDLEVGAGVFFVDRSASSVGIGTTSPSTSLHVSMGSNGSGLIDVARFENEGTTVNDGARIQLTAGASTSGAGIGCLGDALNSAHLVLHAGGNTERMRIKSNGHVGIGTQSPNAKLYISGKDDSVGATDLLALQFDNSPADTGITFRDILDGVKSRFTMDAANTTDLRISSGTQMHFYGGTTNGTGDGHLKIHSTGQVTTPSNPAFRAYLSTERTTNGEITSGWNDNTTAGSRAYDINGNFNISNGRFTAPVAGVYVFSVMWDSLNSHGGLQVFLNGAVYNTMWEPTGFNNAAWESKYHGTHMKLAVNDYVTLVVVHASGSNPVHMGSGVWGHFAGCLVG